MPAKTLRDAVLAAASDTTIRDRLVTEPNTALAAYDLTAEERAALSALARGGSTGDDRAPRSWRDGITPSSFKEVGALLLSAIVVAVFAIVLAATLSRVNDDPRGVLIGSAVHTVDSWSRAKDLLSTVFPLLGAVVTFWLGVAIEGRRAEDNKASAERATEGQRKAETGQAKTHADARETIHRAKAALRESMPQSPEYEVRSGPTGATTGPTLEAALAILDDAERRLG